MLGRTYAETEKLRTNRANSGSDSLDHNSRAFPFDLGRGSSIVGNSFEFPSEAGSTDRSAMRGEARRSAESRYFRAIHN